MAEKVALVTGSACGIGRAVALALAARGYHLVVNYTRSLDEARETVTQVKQLGVECLLVRGDVAVDADCLGLVAAARGGWGRLDLLVNNAGTTTFEELSEESWDRIFAVNVKGAWLMARAASELLRQSRGAIVNISSTAGLDAVGSSIAYSASKAALNNLTVSLSRTLAPEVRVNAIAPGYVDTRWNERLSEKARTRVRSRTAQGEVCQPEDVAQAVVSLLDMERVTGQVLVVDGGYLR